MLQWNHFELGVIALIGVVFAGSLGSVVIRQIFQGHRREASLLKGDFFKVILSILVAGLGLSASILTPIFPLVMLIGAARLLPIRGRAQMSFLIIGCLSIGLGAALSVGDLPSSEIAILKLMGSLFR